jgi:hypothetical protein
VVRALIAKGERVIVLAHANVAVDVAMLRIADSFIGFRELSDGKILRIGVPQLAEMVHAKKSFRRKLLRENCLISSNKNMIWKISGMIVCSD